MKIVVKTNNDWRPVDAEVMSTLVERGFVVSFHYACVNNVWSVEVPEWRDYLSAVWHVYAEISRGSEGVWPLRCKREVKVYIGEIQYPVRYWASLNGILYGSISL